MKLTKEEESLILKIRKEKEKDKPKFKAKAKHDLYTFGPEFRDSCIDLSDFVNEYGWFFSKKIKEEIIEYVGRSIEKAVDKETPFVCYIYKEFDSEGEQLWFDDINFGIEEQTEDWAKQNLINIKLDK